MRTVAGLSGSRVLTALAFFAVAVPAIAVPAARTPQIPRIRVSTRLVQIGVTAHNKDGPAPNLTKSDFVVLDRGRQRDISLLSVESRETLSSSATERPLPGNNFSDLPQYGHSAPSSVTIVLLDNLNTLYGTARSGPFESTPYWMEDLALQNAKTHLVEFVGQMRPSDRVAIYGLGHSLHVVCDFTSDRVRLLAILKKYDVTPKTNREIAEPALMHSPIVQAEPFDNAAAREDAAVANQGRAGETMAALESIAAHVANVPGRKNLVWLTANLPFSVTVMERILVPAGIAAYPIDVRGLLPRQPFQSGGDVMDFNQAARNGTAAPAQSIEPVGNDVMQKLADETGGRAFLNTNDLTGAIRQAVEDSELTYTLGFYIEQDSLDGKFHQLKIEVKRAGVTLRYPRGYFAFADTPATQDQNRSNVLAAVRSPIESSRIPVQVRIDRVEKPLAHCLSIFGSIEIDKLQLAENAGIRKGAANVITIEQDETGKVLAQSASMIRFRLSGKEYAEYLTKGFPFHQFVQPRAGATTLRILVEDTTTAEVGSLIIPLSQIQ
ncbi:MAG TPA: VWA domain-containing protein [Candidatus Limnocylindrales bacterium]|nr:VWA domain-containing protein [Candidatus Limnocylindrales bacterium]